MPNWCENTIVFKGSEEDCAAFRCLLGEEQRTFDFEALAPMPPSLLKCGPASEKAYLIKYGDLPRLESDSVSWGSLGAAFGLSTYPDREAALQAARHTENAAYWDYVEIDEQGRESRVPRSFDEAADEAYANVLQHGHVFSYEWACEHWGTKWNVVRGDAKWQTKTGEVRVDFSTAWDAPRPIFPLLAERFRDAEIVVDWAGIDAPDLPYGKVVFSCGDVVSWEEIPTEDPRHPWHDWLAKNN